MVHSSRRGLTRFWIEGDQIRFRLKNDNEGHDQKVWRYQHFDSNTPFLQKRATLTACLRKVQHQSSDKAAMGYSALEKIAEFRRLLEATLSNEHPIESVHVPRGEYRGRRVDHDQECTPVITERSKGR